MAPELLRFDAFGQEADMWSLSCVMVRLSTVRQLYRKVPSERVSMHAILPRVATGELGPAPTCARGIFPMAAAGSHAAML